jgi:hypothetical protein
VHLGNVCQGSGCLRDLVAPAPIRKWTRRKYRKVVFCGDYVHGPDCAAQVPNILLDTAGCGIGEEVVDDGDPNFTYRLDYMIEPIKVSGQMINRNPEGIGGCFEHVNAMELVVTIKYPASSNELVMQGRFDSCLSGQPGDLTTRGRFRAWPPSSGDHGRRDLDRK